MTDRHDEAQRRLIWPPRPGWFSLRLVTKGWEVPARIICAEGRWHAEIDGVMFADHPDPVHAPRVAAIWQSGTIVDETDYLWRTAVRQGARDRGDHGHPALNPLKRISHMRLKPL